MVRTETDRVLAQLREDRDLKERFGIEMVVELDLARLGGVLADENDDVRRAAARWLGRQAGYGDEAAEIALERAARGKDEALSDAVPIALRLPEELVGVLVTELIGIGEEDGFVGTPGDTFDENRNNNRARRIGAMLDEAGAMGLMRQVHARVAAAFPGSPRGRELQTCWSGIGTWH